MKFFKAYILFILSALLSCRASVEKHAVGLTAQVLHERDSVVKQSRVSADTSYLEYIFRGYDLVDIQSLDSSIHVDLKYSGRDNFLGKDFYDGLRKAYFPCEVALNICNAQQYLKSVNPFYSLLILDAARPHHIQQMMWDSLDMPADKKFNYLAPPFTISLHNYGCAVDLTIIDLSKGGVLDMGSKFDDFSKISEPVYEWHFLRSGELSTTAFENRKLLRKIMQAARMSPINSEWWHFNYCTKEYAAARFQLIK